VRNSRAKRNESACACRNISARSNLLVDVGHTKPAWSWSSYTASMTSQKEHRQRKRGRDQLASEESGSQVSAKRQKRSADNYPPDVWDNLSKITLTRKALREFDRRTRENRHPQAARVQETAPRLLRSAVRRLERFARNGGPDLSKLRGVSMPWQPTNEKTLNQAAVRRSAVY